ncbi:MAG: response regulator transcription factor [Chloroflexi bacterium]|nr:response regulator transcription factor [Chloroflexota bacterium]
MTLTILIAEDDRDVAALVAYGARLTWPGCTVEVAPDGAEALRRFAAMAPDLVVLDVSMPPPDGFEVCRRIREVSTAPILMLTARDTLVDKIGALDLGADDYLTKPFDDLELLARLRALLRRAHGLTGAETPAPPVRVPVLIQGDITLDTTRREVWVRGAVVRLTSTEYRLLEELVRYAGRTLPHRYLLEQVWGPEYIGEVHYLRVFVRRLRQKLGDDPDHPRYIQTEWHTGYRFVPSSQLPTPAVDLC